MNAQAEHAQKGFPSKNELRDVFAKFVGDWAKLEPQEGSLLFKTPAGAAIERKVVFPGRPGFQLVVRTTREFGLIMGRLFTPGLDAVVDPEDAFTEVVNMYCGHLKNTLRDGDSAFSTLLPQKSSREDWPRKDADVACYLRVGAFPVEIMLWKTSET